MNEERSQEYHSMDPKYINGHINSRILSLEANLSLDFYTVSEILKCFILIKRFHNDHKRCSSHSQMLILQGVALIKVYLTIYKSLKSSYLQKVFVP